MYRNVLQFTALRRVVVTAAHCVTPEVGGVRDPVVHLHQVGG